MIDTLPSALGSVDLQKSNWSKKTSGLASAETVDRLPPHSVEAEQGVFGCILLAPHECMGQCIEKFRSGSVVFYDLRHQHLFDLLAEMYDEKAAIDLITLQQRLKDNNQLEAIGGISYLASL